MNTFPTWVYGASRIGVPPQVNVWGTILFTAGLLTAGVNLVASFRATRKTSVTASTAPAMQGAQKQ